jgi:hypothetical protein
MSASELDKSQPIVHLLAPTGAQAAALGKPTEGALNDPAARRELGFTGQGTLLDFRFAATTAVFDRGDIALQFDKLMNIGVIVTFIQAPVLLDLVGIRARDNQGDDPLSHQPLVMKIGSGNVDSQRGAALIHQQVDFAAALAAIDRTFPGVWAAQRCRTGTRVNRLPPPLDFPSALVKARQLGHETLKDPRLSPVLKPLVQGSATHAKPTALHRFPLASRPQPIPNPIHHRPIIGSLSPAPLACGGFRQDAPHSSPQPTRYVKIIHILWLCGMILAHDVSVLIGICRFQSERDTSSFSTLFPIYG